MSLRSILLVNSFTLVYMFACVLTSIHFIESEETLKMIYAIGVVALMVNIIAIDNIEEFLVVKYLRKWESVYINAKQNKFLTISIAINIAVGFNLLLFTKIIVQL